MLDINFILGQQDNVKIFYARDITDWQTWQKPRGCKFIWIMCIGAGMGGQGGAGSTPTQASSGGTSGAITRALFPSTVLPDTLFIQPGTGSIGGVGSSLQNQNLPPENPGRSFVSITPSSATTMNLICTSGLAAGIASTLTAETAATVAAAGLLSLGSFISIAGAGIIGSPTALNTSITCPGAGSPLSTSSAGNNITGISLPGLEVPTIAGGSGGTGGNGENGIISWKPMYFLGGAAGGGNTGGLGGKGGNGAYGCGGGGGGAGSTTGGSGGRGGDGLVIIATF